MVNCISEKCKQKFIRIKILTLVDVDFKYQNPYKYQNPFHIWIWEGDLTTTYMGLGSWYNSSLSIQDGKMYMGERAGIQVFSDLKDLLPAATGSEGRCVHRRLVIVYHALPRSNWIIFLFTKTEIQNEVVIVMNFDVPNNTLKKYYKAQTIRYTGRTDKKKTVLVVNFAQFKRQLEWSTNSWFWNYLLFQQFIKGHFG